MKKQLKKEVKVKGKKKEESGNDEDDESAEEGDGDPSGIANLEEDITNK